LNVVGAYAPQVGYEKKDEEVFWQMDEVIKAISDNEEEVIGENINRQVGRGRKRYEKIHGVYGFGEGNEAEKKVMDLYYRMILQ